MTVRLDVLLLRDMAEERRLSMERFADELGLALSRDPRIAVTSTAIHPSRLSRVPVAGRIDTYLSRYIRYPLHARSRTASVYHVVDQGYGHVAALLPPQRTVITCHDLMLLRATEGGAGFEPRKRSVLRFRWSTSFLRRVGHVACVSETTRQDVIRLLGVEPSRTSVVRSGVHERFRPMNKQHQAALSRELRRNHTHAILHVASPNSYKNVEGTLRVTRRLIDMGYDVALVRVGPPLADKDARLTRELRLGGVIVECGRVPDERLVELYNASDCLLFPSFWEGFGWPPLEAMACGTPVVVSTAPALVETVGDAGLIAPATDIDALAGAVHSILSSTDRASDLAARGTQRASRFRWERTAASYTEIYEQLASSVGPRGSHERANWNSLSPGARRAVPLHVARSPIRVLQVIAGLDSVSGGPPTAAVTTSLALRSCGARNTFAYVDGRGNAPTSEVLSAAGIDTYRFPVTKATGIWGVRWGVSLRLAVWLLRNAPRFDVLHVHGAWTFTTAASLGAARLRRRVAVLSSHESLTDFDRMKSGALHGSIKHLLRWVYVRLFNVVVVASTLEQGGIGDHAGRRSIVIPHAVSSASGRRQSLSNGNEPFRIGFLGRLHPKKNLEVLIDAVSALPKDVSLDVAGDGPPAYRDSLLSRARSRGLGARIRWLGFVEGAAKRRFLESIDVLAMPSKFEGFGVAAAEAIAAGVPVIVSSDTGIASLVERHGCGAVVDPDAPHLRRELERVAFLRGDARRATVQARVELSPDVHGAALLQLYDELINRPVRGRRA